MELIKIQQELKAPKNQKNSFGGYVYRSCEDILEAVKPLLGDSLLTLSDDIVEVGGWIYVKATATFTDGTKSISVTAFARETETKKGMDASQITGSASSYARKYALNGLFLIDDTKDADVQKPTPVKTYEYDLAAIAKINKLINKKEYAAAEKAIKFFKGKGFNTENEELELDLAKTE